MTSLSYVHLDVCDEIFVEAVMVIIQILNIMSRLLTHHYDPVLCVLLSIFPL